MKKSNETCSRDSKRKDSHARHYCHERSALFAIMPTVAIHLQTPIRRTPRVLQLEGLFDLPPGRVSAVIWTAELPLDDKPWDIGLIIGPSGCGKSTLARRLWPEQM